MATNPGVPTVRGLEGQARDHGYTIKTVVKENGKCVVTLTAAAYGASAGNTIAADSGEDDSLTRYTTALTTAVARMLDYEYRSKPEQRPSIGHGVGREF